MKLIIKGLFVTLINVTQLNYNLHYAECRILFIVLLNVIMLSCRYAVMLYVVMLSIIMLNVIMPCVIML